MDLHWRHLELYIPQQLSLLFLYFLFLKLLVTTIHLHKPTFLHFQHSMEARLSPKCRLNWTVTHKTNIHKRPSCNFFKIQRKLKRDFGDRFSNEKLDQFSESYYLSLNLKEDNMFSFPMTLLCAYELELFLLCIWFLWQWGGVDFKWCVSTSVLSLLWFMCYSWLALQTWLIHRCKCY